MSLLYLLFLDQTTVGQSGGFFLHMFVGQPKESSIGTSITTAGAGLLAAAVGILIYGLVTTR